MFYVLKLELGAFATTGLIVESSEAAVEIEVEVEIEEMLWDRSRFHNISDMRDRGRTFIMLFGTEHMLMGGLNVPTIILFLDLRR